MVEESMLIQNGRSLVVEGEVITILCDDVEPEPNQPRTEFDPDKLQELADSIKAIGQRVPGFVRPKPGFLGKYILVDGERRWRACGMVDVKTLKAIIVEGDEGQLFIHSVIANFARVGHSPLETAWAIARIKKITGEASVKIAKYFGQSQPWVDQHLALLRLPEEVHRLMQAPYPLKKRLRFSVALLLVTLPHDEQVKMAHEFHANATKFSKAKFLVEQKRNELQIAGKRTVKPHDQYRKLRRFLANLAESSELLLTMSNTAFEEMFKNRSTDEEEDIRKLLTDCRENLESLQQVIERMQKKAV
jgi:ParB/RepB/Spo0J family partition protein